MTKYEINFYYFTYFRNAKNKINACFKNKFKLTYNKGDS